MIRWHCSVASVCECEGLYWPALTIGSLVVTPLVVRGFKIVGVEDPDRALVPDGRPAGGIRDDQRALRGLFQPDQPDRKASLLQPAHNNPGRVLIRKYPGQGVDLIRDPDPDGSPPLFPAEMSHNKQPEPGAGIFEAVGPSSRRRTDAAYTLPHR